MKKNTVSISNPDELNKYLQHTSIATWIILGAVILVINAFFTWSFLYKIKAKITGIASIVDHQVTLHVNQADLKKLTVGLEVYIEEQKGQILSFDDKGQPVVSTFDLADDDYPYYVMVEMKPINFLISR